MLLPPIPLSSSPPIMHDENGIEQSDEKLDLDELLTELETGLDVDPDSVPRSKLPPNPTIQLPYPEGSLLRIYSRIKR